MAKYKAIARGYDGKRIIEVGEVFEFAGKRGKWMVPLEGEGGHEHKPQSHRKADVKDDTPVTTAETKPAVTPEVPQAPAAAQAPAKGGGKGKKAGK